MLSILLKFNFDCSVEIGNDTFYYCLNPDTTVAETCYESIDNSTDNYTITQSDSNFYFDDGACCEDNQKKAFCCIIELNEAMALK